MNARRCWFALSISLLAALGCGSENKGGAHDRLELSPNAPPDAAPPNDPPDPQDPNELGEQPEPDTGTDDGQCTTPVADGGALTGDLPLTVTGSVVGKGNDFVIGPPLCRESETNASEDVVYTFTAKEAGTYRFTSWATATSPSFPNGIVMTLAEPLCGAPELTCQAYDVPPGVDLSMTAGQTVLVIIDPVFTTFTDYVLKIEKK